MRHHLFCIVWMLCKTEFLFDQKYYVDLISKFVHFFNENAD